MIAVNINTPVPTAKLTHKCAQEYVFASARKNYTKKSLKVACARGLNMLKGVCFTTEGPVSIEANQPSTKRQR